MKTYLREVVATTGLLAMLGVNVWPMRAPSSPTLGQADDTAPKPAATSSVPDHAKSYYHFMLARRYKELAGVYNRSDYIDRAVSEYKQAIATDPDSLFLRVELAELYSLSGHTDEGIKEAEAVLKVDPNYPDAHRLLSRIYYHMLETAQGDQGVPKEDLAKAIEHLEALVRVMPGDTDSLLLLGHLYRVDNKPAKAEEVFRKVLQTDPDSKVGLANLAELYIQQSEFRRRPSRRSARFPKAIWIPGFITCWAIPTRKLSNLTKPLAPMKRRWRRIPTTPTFAAITPTRS